MSKLKKLLKKLIVFYTTSYIWSKLKSLLWKKAKRKDRKDIEIE